MTKTKDYRQPKALNLDLNKRFTLFRKQEFKTQQLAADFLGVTQKIISDIERGVIDVNPAYIMKMVKERKLNRQWYDYGTGSVKTDGSVKPKSTITDIGDIKAKIEQLEAQVSRLEKREKDTYKMLEVIKDLLESSPSAESINEKK